jgi:hypothetical protein
MLSACIHSYNSFSCHPQASTVGAVDSTISAERRAAEAMCVVTGLEQVYGAKALEARRCVPSRNHYHQQLTFTVQQLKPTKTPGIDTCLHCPCCCSLRTKIVHLQLRIHKLIKNPCAFDVPSDPAEERTAADIVQVSQGSQPTIAAVCCVAFC